MKQVIAPRDEKQDFEGSLISVEPRSTDPRITDWTEPHQVFRDPRAVANGCLLLFLTGSNGVPGRQTFLLGLAANMGYTAINLRYPNSWTVQDLCRRSGDRNCHRNIRLHISEGIPSGMLPAVRPHDSIVGRLGKLLVWLEQNSGDATRPSFLRNGGIEWDRIVVAGHSQGGGHAAMIGKCHAVKRVIMLGAPADFSFSQNSPAPWLHTRGETPAARQYGFIHSQDRGFSRIIQAWGALGMSEFGGIVNVDKESPPYRMSHQLASSAPVPMGKFHGSVANDGMTARSFDGTPAYLPVWRYLLQTIDPAQ